MASLVGKNLGKFLVTERLGKGGMAEVYKARHPRLDRDVAIKVLHGFLAEDSDFLARFEREAKAIAALRHPNIIQMYDFDIADDDYFMVMEYVDGGSLKENLCDLAAKKAYMAYHDVARIFQQMASALDYAHQQGMLHRDIKPANILIDLTGNAFLTDFGIARILSDSHITVTGTLIGTPAYMSPEQGQGLNATIASEVYSLGIILYELVTGKTPFDSDTPYGLIMKHVHEPLPPPRTIRSDLSEDLEQVICNALAKDPEDRYQSAFELLQAAMFVLDPLQQTQSDALPQKSSGLIAADRVGPELSHVSEQSMGEEFRADSGTHDVIASASTVAMDRSIRGKSDLQDAAAGEDRSVQKDAEVGILPRSKSEEMAARDTLAMDPDMPLSSMSGSVPMVEHRAEDAEDLPFIQPEDKEKQTSKRPKRLIWLMVMIVIGLLAVGSGLIYSGILDFPPEEPCSEFELCLESIGPYWEEQNFSEIISRLDKAIELRPGDERQPFAFLWCEKGHAYFEMGDLESAIENFSTCIDWTEGHPEGEDLRMLAIEHIDIIERRLNGE
jgi:serine/threonine protein kinase